MSKAKMYSSKQVAKMFNITKATMLNWMKLENNGITRISLGNGFYYGDEDIETIKQFILKKYNLI